MASEAVLALAQLVPVGLDMLVVTWLDFRCKVVDLLANVSLLLFSKIDGVDPAGVGLAVADISSLDKSRAVKRVEKNWFPCGWPSVGLSFDVVHVARS